MSAYLQPIDFWIFGLYILGVIILGLWASCKKSVTKRDYFLAGDKLPWWMIGGSIVAANLSSHHLVGGIGVAYDRGFITVSGEWAGVLLGINALLWIFLPFYLRNGFYTMPEFLQRRFGAAPRIVFALLMLLTYLFVEISGVLILGAIALEQLLHLNLAWSIVVIAIATGIYTITGGLRAVIWTEMLQLCVLLLGGFSLAYMTIRAVGGIQPFLDTQSDWHLLLPANDPDFPWTKYLGGSLCVSIFYFATNQFIVQRVLAAKNEWHARMGIVFTCYLKFLVPLMITVPGLLAILLVQNGTIPKPEKPDMIFSLLVVHLLPHGLIGLVLAGLVAAIMGHLSGAINSCSTIATIDLFLPFREAMKERRLSRDSNSSIKAGSLENNGSADNADKLGKKQSELSAAPKLELSAENQSEKSSKMTEEDRIAILFGKIFAGIIILLGIGWAILLSGYIDRPIYIYLMKAYSYFAPGIATMFIMGIFWKRTTYWGATFAGLLTVPLTICLDFLFPTWPFYNRAGIVFWVCMFSCCLVSLFTKPKSDEELKGLIWNPSSIRLPEDQRNASNVFCRPGFWWLIITAVILSFFIMYP
ncbi:MAG: sodium/solute symporter [Planctomycetia bacterium]|nr:sodium/solute symporter [Planctomycetia bacterium]